MFESGRFLGGQRLVRWMFWRCLRRTTQSRWCRGESSPRARRSGDAGAAGVDGWTDGCGGSSVGCCGGGGGGGGGGSSGQSWTRMGRRWALVRFKTRPDPSTLTE